MKKNIFIFALILIVVLTGLFYFLNKKSNDDKEITSVKVKKSTLRIAFSIDGKTVVERRDPKFVISGKVVHIAVKEGQEVKKGQYLMALDTQEVRKNLEKALKDYLIARNDHDQLNLVTYPNGALNDTIKRILEKNQYSLDKAVIDVELKDIALRESYLYSPIDGIVSSINIKEGEIVNAQGTIPIITITQPSSIFFEAYGEDSEILKISKEQKILIKLDALPGQTFTGKLDFISNLATVDSNGFSTYKIRAVIDNKKNIDLLDGMSGEITFITKEKPNVINIPNAAVYRRDGKSYVQKLVNNKTKEVEVVTGFTDGKSVEIISGLSLEDTVVLQ